MEVLHRIHMSNWAEFTKVFLGTMLVERMMILSIASVEKVLKSGEKNLNFRVVSLSSLRRRVSIRTRTPAVFDLFRTKEHSRFYEIFAEHGRETKQCRSIYAYALEFD